MKQYGLVVIGSGSGLMILEEALNQGIPCAIIETAKFGGTCLNKGCIPSKMLVYPADLLREIEKSNRIGIKTCQPQIEWDTISRRMWEQIDLNSEIENNLKNVPNLTVYQGTGSFTGINSMRIHYDTNKPDDVIYGEEFIIAAGARPFIPQVEGLQNAGYVTSDSFFGEKFPQKPWKSLVIIGGGAISAEFAHILSAFGTKVTIVERSHQILNKEEEEIRDFVKQNFTEHGIDVLTDSSVLSVSKDDTMKYVTIENRVTQRITTIDCEEIFVASGVQSNADTLSIENAGIAVNEKGWIITNQYLETSQNHIWALGDINGKYQFRHKANYEAEILIHNLFSGREKKEVRYDIVPWAIFTLPQVARVGMTERQLKDKGIKYATAFNYYSDVVGGISMGIHDGDADNGFVKLIVGENKKILGVHIAGPQAAVLLQPFVYLMNDQTGTYSVIQDSMVIHPSLSELTAWAISKIGR